MARESFAQLIARKSALYAEQFELNRKQSTTDEQLLYSTPESYARDKIEAFKVDADVLATNAKINRAHLFGQRWAREPVPQFCMACFVDQGVLAHMVEDPEGHWSGDMSFKCSACGVSLQVTRVDSPTG